MHRTIITGIALCISGAAAAQEPPSPGQRLAIQTKPSVVRVVAGYLVDIDSGQGQPERRFVGGHGSGFFVDPDGYIATNAHVVEFLHIGDEKAHAKIVQDYVVSLAQQNNVDLRTIPAPKMQELMQLAGRAIRIARKVSVVVLPDGEQKVYDIKSYGAPVGSEGSKDIAIVKIQIKNAPTLPIGDESSVQLQDRIFALGYPGAADDLVGVLDEKAMLEASITDGTVSALKKSADGVPVIQVTTIISPGNSGGPAVNDKGEVIGLATFGHARQQGYNFIVPSSTLREFVQQAGATNEQSITNQLFEEGLAHYWAGRYTRAIEKFEEVQQLFPAHSEVKGLIGEAHELKRLGKEKKPAGGTGTTVAAIIAVAVIVGGLVTFGLWRAHKRRLASLATARPHRAVVMPAARAAGAAPAEVGAAAADGAPQRPGAHAMTMPAPPRIRRVEGSSPPPPQATPQPQTTPAGGWAKTVAVSPSAAGSSLAGLICVRGVLLGQHFPLGAHGIVIGRDPGTAQIVISDGRVSGKHVWIGFQDGKLVAIDQGSTNGTFVNDMQRGRVTCAELKNGDTIIVSEPDVLTVNVLLGGR